MPTITPVELRPARDRCATRIGWLNSHHSFSFGRHFDPTNVGHGLLLVNNDDIVHGGNGFDTHPHQDMEIVTWVLAGQLEHKDSEGNHGLLYPGLAQRMSAGTGIWHSEMNPTSHEDVHFVQMWVPPDNERVNPSYEQLDINTLLDAGGLVPVASGKGHNSAISIRQKDAVLYAARLAPGQHVEVPDERHVHIFVPVGSATLDLSTPNPATLESGDAARLTGAGTRTLTGGNHGAEVLIWATR
jgi:quercetin 2,3-dioxygenase